VLDGDRAVGTVTSGTFSPTLQSSLAMALVEPSLSRVGTPLTLDVRGRREPARVVELPFYRRSPHSQK
jgi:aminomethyltransferase